MRSADWKVMIGTVSVALGLLFGSIWAVGFIEDWGGWGGVNAFQSILHFYWSLYYFRAPVKWFLLIVGVLLFVVGLSSFKRAERTRPLWKIVTVLVCAGFVLLTIGMGIFTVGMQRTVITEIYGHYDPPVMEWAITLDPKEQYTITLWVDVNEPPLAPNGDPNSYILINYHDITGNVELYYKDPAGWTVSTSVLSGSGTTKLSSSLAGNSELVLENVGNTEAKISRLDASDHYYGLRENREIVGIVGVPVIIAFALIGAGFVLMLHDTDRI